VLLRQLINLKDIQHFVNRCLPVLSGFSILPPVILMSSHASSSFPLIDSLLCSLYPGLSRKKRMVINAKNCQKSGMHSKNLVSLVRDMDNKYKKRAMNSMILAVLEDEMI